MWKHLHLIARQEPRKHIVPISLPEEAHPEDRKDNDEVSIACVAKRRAQCLVYYDLPMCTSDQKSDDKCPHRIQIPLLQLWQSEISTDCQLCHVFYGAIRPFVTSVDDSVLKQTVLVAAEGLRGTEGCDLLVGLSPEGPETRMKIFHYDYEEQSRLKFRESRLYSAQLFMRPDSGRLWFRTEMLNRRFPIETSPHSGACISMIRNWINDCLSTHDSVNTESPIVEHSDRIVSFV
ncbi:hypothetical protein F5Y16DRAFT_107904 [Xylariaceae sp. FL0255]|nr:hypothetical protein F5Y16DRAFT_107904 [Xylariaceae sp. FL0255]